MNFNIIMGKRCIAISCLILLFLAACDGDDVNSVSAADEPVSEVSSSSSEKMSSSESRVKSSSSSARNNSSSSEKAKSSSSSLVKSSSSSSVVLSSSAKSSSSSAKSSSSNEKSSSSVRNGSSSSLVVSEGWSWDVPKELRLNPKKKYDSITDSRDGKVYKTIKIGKQVWMAENLNYADSVATPSLKGQSWCYKNKPQNCDVMGRLYAWEAAVDSVKCGWGESCTFSAKVRGICPSGWHLPNKSEWNALFSAVGGQSTAGRALKSLSGWDKSGNGTDAYGFSALPASYRSFDWTYDRDSFFYTGTSTYFWSATEYKEWSAYYIALYYLSEDVTVDYNTKRNYGYSVRCLKDEDEVTGDNSSSSSLTIPDDWSWDVPKEARLNPEIEYDSITDSRDGKVYKTVKIGDQTWMAENLNYDATDWNSWCFGKSNNKDSSTCDVAGRLYTWAAAIDSIKLKALKSIVCGYGRSCTLPDMVDGICPSGWHLPNNAEWKDLFSAVGDISTAGKVLKSQSGWVNKGNGSDTYGFSALPTGDRGSNGNFYNDGAIAYFWSSTTNSGTDAYTVELNNHFDRAYLRLDPKNFGFSVRCLKN